MPILNGKSRFSLQVKGPPANDECENAEMVELDEYYEGMTYGATGSEDETTCGMGGMGDSYSVWYQYNASDYGTVVFQVESWDECGLGITLALYDMCDETTRTELVCESGEECMGMGSSTEIAYSVQGGQTYYLRVAYEEERMGEFSLELTYYSPPVNDECANATAINLDEYVGDATYGATGTNITSCGWDSNNDVWYTFTADNDETLYFMMEVDNECSPCATIALFDDCPDNGGNELACESCNCYPGSAEIEYEVTTGTT